MARDQDWVKLAALLVVAQHLAAALISLFLDFPGRPQTTSYMLMAFVLSALGATFLLLRTIWQMWRDNEERPLHLLVATAKAKPTVIVAYFIGFQLVALQIAALTWLKEMIPFLVPYWADPSLAQIDQFLLGTHAWKLIPAFMISGFGFLLHAVGAIQVSRPNPRLGCAGIKVEIPGNAVLFSNRGRTGSRRTIYVVIRRPDLLRSPDRNK